MKILLDTHTWIWAANADTRLPASFKKIILTSKDTDLYLLDISIWEAGRVHRAGQLTAGDPKIWFNEALRFVSTIQITSEIALFEQALSWDHKDPADRMIVSAAIVNNLSLMTVDKRILKFDHVNTISLD